MAPPCEMWRCGPCETAHKPDGCCAFHTGRHHAIDALVVNGLLSALQSRTDNASGDSSAAPMFGRGRRECHPAASRRPWVFAERTGPRHGALQVTRTERTSTLCSGPIMRPPGRLSIPDGRQHPTPCRHLIPRSGQLDLENILPMVHRGWAIMVRWWNSLIITKGWMFIALR